MATVDTVGFEALARPLLELLQRLTGLETSFVTTIDWAAQTQSVVVSLSRDELMIPEGTVTPWEDTMCRHALLNGREQSADVPAHFPTNAAAAALELQSFVTVPIVYGDATLGTVCGASRSTIELEPEAVDHVRLIAEALSHQMATMREAEQLRERAERAEALSVIDALTGLYNRRGFNARLEEELARSGRHGVPLAVLAIDLDHFKAVNDTYGHAGGDAVLTALGQELAHLARTEDVAARLGGDEFAVLLAHCDHAGALRVAGRIATGFERATAALGTPCTLSIGIATTATSELASLMADADKALYACKAQRAS